MSLRSSTVHGIRSKPSKPPWRVLPLSLVGTHGLAVEGEPASGEAVRDPADGGAEVAAGEPVRHRVRVAEHDVGRGIPVADAHAAHRGSNREHLELDSGVAQHDRLRCGGVRWVEDAGRDDGIRRQRAVDVRELLTGRGVAHLPHEGCGEPVGVDRQQHEVAVVVGVVPAEDPGDLLGGRAVDEALLLEGATSSVDPR